MCYTVMQVSTGSNDGELVKINRTSKVFDIIPLPRLYKGFLKDRIQSL